MKRLLLILLLSFSFIVSSYADSDSCINAYDNESYENIVIECTTPANEGDMVSQNILGWIYLNGVGVTKDYSIAFSWISKSAEQGNTWALGQLGLMYQNGHSVSKDYNQAFTLLTNAGKDWEKELQALELLIKEEAEAEAKKKAEEAAEAEIDQAIDKIENTKTIPANRIGKWYTSDSGIESDTCNGIDTSEIIVLHDQILYRTYSNDYSFLESDFESKYYNFFDDKNLLFFPKNIIYASYLEPEIWDFYFETPMFSELESNPLYISLNLFKCNNLNNQIDYILLESDAIEFDKLIYSAKNKCQNNKPIDCLREFVDFADVSNNNELSRAELTRFAKFVVKWLTLKGELKLNERMGSSFATMAIAPALSEFILLNYDYDNDDHIDIKEMTFDIVNISGDSELNNKIIRRYIEVLDLLSESKTNASRMLDDLL
jgi:hypothetical protein